MEDGLNNPVVSSFTNSVSVGTERAIAASETVVLNVEL
jgi:hypothetical protein